MTKRHRFITIARLALEQRSADLDAVMGALDCFLAMPEKCIPDLKSLRFFAHDVCDYFMGCSSRCELNWPNAAAYVKKWKDKWLPRGVEADHIPGEHPGAVWSTDANLVVRSVHGSALEKAGLTAARMRNRSVKDIWGSEDPGHPVVGAHLASLGGETVTNEVNHLGVRWRIITVPRFASGKVVGVDGVSIMVPAETLKSTVRCRPESVYSSPDLPAMAFPIAMWKTDRALTIVAATGGGLILAGTPAKDIIGRSLVEIYTADEWDLVSPMYEASLRGYSKMMQVALRGHSWCFTSTPLIEHDDVVGTTNAAVLIPELVGKDGCNGVATHESLRSPGLPKEE